jgi:hypothetical protein
MRESWFSKGPDKRGHRRRWLAICLPVLLAFAGPAMAEYWTHYANIRFGYETDIPPLYVGQGESANGDGQVFLLPDGLQSLTVWGGMLYEAPHSLQPLASKNLQHDMQQGLSVNFQSSTPEWAVWSGTLGGRVIYQRMILLCDGETYGAFRSEYETRDLNAMHAIIEGVVRSFKATDC